MKPRFDEVEARVLQVIEGTARFDDVLPEVVAYQRAWNPTLDAWWNRRGYCGGPDVPGVPTDVFRHTVLCSSERPVQQVFRTSGTTHGARGEHHRFSLNAYDAGAIAWFRTQVPVHETHRIVPLVFSKEEAPDSSLSHMVDLFTQTYNEEAPAYLLTRDGLDPTSLSALASLSSPIILFGTAWALVHLIDSLPEPISLPEGSVTVETGGYKGRSRTLSPSEFRSSLQRHLGVPTHRQYSEYSMTELSSQLYRCNDAPYQTPPWCRVDAVDPITLHPLPPGERGLLRFIDLANTETVVSIQTSDVGSVTPEGICLDGRASDAAPRGCSLAVEEVISLLQRSD